MLLNSFKEALKPCTSSSSSSTSSSLFSSTIISKSPQRIPPKSSLSQQLKRLEDNSTKAQLNGLSIKPPGEEEEDGHKFLSRRRKKPAQNQIHDSHGPYEPLVLSEPGESPVFQVPAAINCRLLEHQREGVRFLYRLYKKNQGGVLGDDMGLGKTIQTIAFLAAVLGKGEGSTATCLNQTEEILRKNKILILIICPTSVIRNWEHEFSNWGNFSIAVYHGINRELVLDKIGPRSIEVLLTSFDTFRINDKILSGFPWEIVIVDEAHRLKSEKSKLYEACLGIKTRKRFGLTGTIMQNKIIELFNLFDWVAPGSLGTREHFREFYDEPLKHGQRSSAPERYVQVAEDRKQHLVRVLQKYLLRRTKEETIGHLMMGKEDNIVFCAMSEVQRHAYRRMLDQPEVQNLIKRDLPCSCGSPLTRAECCYRTVQNGIIWSYLHQDNPEGCEHCPFCLVLPCLSKLQQISNHLELIKPNPKDDPEKQKKDADLAAAIFGNDVDLVGGNKQIESFMGLSDVEHCGKMKTLEKLLLLWISGGDKVLLFSYSVRMLDILEKFLIRKGYCFSRLDGSTPMSCRQPLVDDFNQSPSKQVFLISTRAGGLGLNLVSANRVVIFDPNWNPAQDLQAQDRSFRYGQRRHVVVFRLLAASSLEELIYTRQVYKQQLSNIAVSGKTEKRYFEGVQGSKEHQGELFGICNLFRDLSDKVFTSDIVKSYNECKKQPCSSDRALMEDSEDEIVEDNAEPVAHPWLEKSNETSFARDESGQLDGQVVPSHGEKESLTLLKLLHGTGIIYAHRNEDIVNSTRDNRPKNFDMINKKKLQQFSLLAQFNGMDDLVLSKWLLSASPSQRKKLLLDYKSKRRKQKHKITV